MLEGKLGWKDHKDICNKIKRLKSEVVSAGDSLAAEFGGTEKFLKTSLVKKGVFEYMDIIGESLDPPQAVTAKNLNEQYILARTRLTEAYVKCGEVSMSSVAFRLAAENMLDLLCLTYKRAKGEHVRYKYCGWMVAGGMDQEALNYLCYFKHRQLRSVPYLDLFNDEDIEGETYLEMLKSGEFDMWFHDFMLIALIKYKRLQAHLVQKKKEEASWSTFLMGTHPRVGKKSSVLKIRGKTLIVERVKGLVLTLDERVDLLTGQIQKILAAVNDENPLIIPGIIDRRSIPQRTEEVVKEDVDESFDDDEITRTENDDIHDACWAWANYGYAWNMSHSYTRVLGHFLRTGNVTIKGLSKKLDIIPIEGYLQAAFDADPSRFYGRQDDLFIGTDGISFF